MSWRYQPPALSPVSPAALLAGFAAAVGRSPADKQVVTDELKRRYRATDVMLTDSGTSALVIALQSLVPPGGTVAYPAYACIDLTAAALRARVMVRLYDLDPLTMSPDMDSLRKTIERGVDAVLVAHLYGYPADLTAVNALAAEHGIPVIEDAAQAAGGTLHDVRLGALADVSILSFGRGKGTTAGSGGALLSRSLDGAAVTPAMEGLTLGEASRGAQELVALSAQWLLARSELYRLPASLPALKLGEMTYKEAREPRSISAAAAAMLPIALRLEERELSHRRRRAEELIALLRQTSGLLPIRCVPGGGAGFLRLAFLDTIGDTRPNESIGVMRGYPLTLDQHEQLAPVLAGGERAGRGAQRLRDRLFTAPTHSRVTASDVARFERWLIRSNAPAPLAAVVS